MGRSTGDKHPNSNTILHCTHTFPYCRHRLPLHTPSLTENTPYSTQTAHIHRTPLPIHIPCRHNMHTSYIYHIYHTHTAQNISMPIQHIVCIHTNLTHIPYIPLSTCIPHASHDTHHTHPIHYLHLGACGSITSGQFSALFFHLFLAASLSFPPSLPCLHPNFQSVMKNIFQPNHGKSGLGLVPGSQQHWTLPGKVSLHFWL